MSFLATVDDFLSQIISECEEAGISLQSYEIDHVCYRCETPEEYHLLCNELKGIGKLLLESMISNRPIASFELDTPLKFRNWTIRCVEIPFPKPGRFYARGFEHIEVVVGDDKSTPLNNKEDLLRFASNFSSISFEESSIDKEVNAELRLPLASGAVKFHIWPLYKVCAYEIENNHFIPVPEDRF